jgi:hypothetical protein
MFEGGARTFVCRTAAEKNAAVRAIHQIISDLPPGAEVRTFDKLAAKMGIDVAANCAAACVSWKELSRLAADPLVTIARTR